MEINANAMNEHVGSLFSVLDDPSGSVFLTLTSVVEHAKTERMETFSLFFQGPANSYLPQRTYKLNHATLGELEIFLVPIAQNKDGFHYEAVFNLIF